MRDAFLWFDELIEEFPAAEKYRVHILRIRQDAQLLIAASQEGQSQADQANAMIGELVSLRQRFSDESVALRGRLALRAYIAENWEKSVAYTNIVVSIGFVGLFAAWSQTSELLSPLQNRLVGVLSLFSLAVFILFEVLKMIQGQVAMSHMIATAEADVSRFDEEFRKLEAYGKLSQATHAWSWRIALFLTLAGALAAAAILAYGLLEKLF